VALKPHCPQRQLLHPSNQCSNPPRQTLYYNRSWLLQRFPKRCWTFARGIGHSPFATTKCARNGLIRSICIASTDIAEFQPEVALLDATDHRNLVLCLLIWQILPGTKDRSVCPS
jgi:hypothetical protein